MPGTGRSRWRNGQDDFDDRSMQTLGLNYMEFGMSLFTNIYLFFGIKIFSSETDIRPIIRKLDDRPAPLHPFFPW
jgi:hypothetical protein